MATQSFVTTHKWKLDNFNRRISGIRENSPIFSDIFSLNGTSYTKCSMRFLCFARTRFSFYLDCNNFGRNRELRLSVKSWIENSEGKIGFESKEESVFNKNENTFFDATYQINQLKELTVDNTLFICCEITYEKPIDEPDFRNSEDDNDELSAHEEHGRNLLDLHSAGHYDLTFQVEGKELKASKLALMSCSKVFQTMFSFPKSTEATTGIVKIDDVSADLIETMIHWSYNIKIANMSKIVMELYRVADKYDITLLKKKCTKVMADNLSHENLYSRLILAYNFKEEALKKYILNYLREDYKKVQHLVMSQEWFDYCFNEPELAKKILEELYA